MGFALPARLVRIEWMSLISDPIAARINAAAADDDDDDVSAARATIARDGAPAAADRVSLNCRCVQMALHGPNLGGMVVVAVLCKTVKHKWKNL